MAGPGDYIGEWNYMQPRGEVHYAKSRILLEGHQNQTISFPKSPAALSTVNGIGDDFAYRVRMAQETYGKIAPTVREVRLQLRGRSADVSLNRSSGLTSLRVQCTLSGARGTAIFRISADGGTAWSSVQTSVVGAATMSWADAAYATDANNALVKWQVINVGNAGNYVNGDTWDISTAGVVTYTNTGGGTPYNGITITPTPQKVTIGVRSTFTEPFVRAYLFEAKVAGAQESQTGYATLDPFGDLYFYTNTMNAVWTEVFADINGFLLS